MRLFVLSSLVVSLFASAWQPAAGLEPYEPAPPPAEMAEPVAPPPPNAPFEGLPASGMPALPTPPPAPEPITDLDYHPPFDFPVPPEKTPPDNWEKGVGPEKMPVAPPKPAPVIEDNLNVSLMVGKSEVLNGEVLDAVLFVDAREAFAGVNVVLTLPSGLAYVDGSAPLATFDPKASTLTWTGITVGPGTTIVDGARLRVEVEMVPAKLGVTLATEVPGFKQAELTQQVVAVGEAQPAQAVSKSAGGRVVVKDRITVDFPADALAADKAIESVVYALAPAADAVAPPDVHFSLGPDQDFDKPVQVKVDLAGLVNLGAKEDQRGLVLQHLRTETIVRTMRTLSGEREFSFVVTTAEDVPSVFDPATGILTAYLEHFSSYQVGLNQPADPKPWKTGGTAPGVSLFRGAANYTFPIYMPALIDGLQPQLALQYSSAAADNKVGGDTNRLPPGEAFALGRGWSMDMPKITRLVKRGWADVSGAYQFITDYKNLFTLELNGATYTLVPAVAGQHSGAYITDDYVPLKITRCNERTNLTSFPECDDYLVATGDDPNPTGEYWHVKTPDGTLYLFGIKGNNTNLVSQYDPENGAYSPSTTDARYAGSSSGQIARAWFLHGVYAAERDLAWNGSTWAAANWTAYYQYSTINQTIPNPLCGCGTPADDYRIRPTEIQYGYGIDTAGNPQSTRYKVTFAYDPWNWLNQINVAWGATPLRQYNIDYVQQNLGGEVIVNQTAVHEWHYGAAWAKLPSPTFTYIDVSIGGDAKRLLHTVSNGYGATWTFGYAAHVWANGHHVTRKTVNSGTANAAVEVTDYEYSSPCFDNPGQPCYKPGREMPGSWLGGNFPETNALMGYAQVSEYHRDISNNTIACTTHHFHHDEWARLGREYLTRNWSANCGSILSSRQTVHAIRSLTSQGVSAQRVVVDDTYEYPAGDWGTSPNIRTSFTRDSDNNPISTYEYGLDTRSDDQRSTHRWYGSNTGRWFIGLLQREDVYSAIASRGSSTMLPYANLNARQIIYYGTSTVWSAAPATSRVGKTMLGHPQGGVYLHEAYTYNAIGNLMTLRDRNSMASGNNYVTQAAYDLTGHFLISITKPMTGHVTSYEYYGVNEGVTGGSGPRGALKRVIGPNGSSDVVMFAYDQAGRLRKTVKPGDAWDAPTQEVFYLDANGASDWGATSAATPFVVQTFTRKSPNHGTPAWGYDTKWWACGTCGLDTNALATWGRTLYDGLGRQVQMQTPAPLWPSPNQVVATTIGYDALGRSVTATVPYTAPDAVPMFLAPPAGTLQTSTVYDALSRPTSVAGPDGVAVHTRYGMDSTGWPGFSATSGLFVRTVDGNNHHKMAVTDGLGRAIRSREFTGTCTVDDTTCLAGTTWYDTKYTYDALGNTLIVTDSGGLQTEMYYNGGGFKTWMSDPDMGVWNYTVDSNGNTTNIVDGKGQKLGFQYDKLNRLTRKWGGTIDNYYYYDTRYDGSAWPNGIGRLVEAGAFVSGSWNNSFLPSYDERGRQTRLWRAFDTGHNYYSYNAYDSADRVASTTYPTGEVVAVGYNAAGFPNSLVGTDTYVSGATYNVLGKPSTISLGNGLTTRYQYHGLENEWPRTYWGNQMWGKMAQICVYTGGACGTWDGGAPIRHNQIFLYDGSGNVTVTNDMKADMYMTWAYDALDRLTTVTPTGGANAYSASYTYAANGNMTYKSNLGTMNYAAKVDNNPSGRSIPHALSDIASTDYTGLVAKYDGNGNMYERWHQGTWYCQQFNIENRLTRVYDCADSNPDVKFDYDAAGTLVRRVDNVSAVWTHYIGPHAESTWGVWTNYYLFNGQRVAVRNASGGFYLHADHLGSASVTTNLMGTEVGSRRYYPYGEGILISGNQQTDRRFTGQRQEQDFGMYDYGARYYVPLLGRFISADTIVPEAGNPQALNRYAYVFNNPMRYTDPSGHDPFEDGTWWTEYCQHSQCGAEPTDYDRQNWLFSLALPGMVSKGAKWNEQDWQAFWGMGRNFVFSWDVSEHRNRGRFTKDDFANQIRRLGAHYANDEVDQFVRALGALYAQLPYENYGSLEDAIRQGAGGFFGDRASRIDVPGCNGDNDTCGWMHNMSGGWSTAYVTERGVEQTHHYVGHLWSSFYFGNWGANVNAAGTVLREATQGMDDTDIYLGWLAGIHGQFLYQRIITPATLGDWIARDLGR